MERIKKFAVHIVAIVAYVVASVIYLINLAAYNKELVGLNYLEIVMYREGKTWDYFIGALVLVALGCFMIYLGIKTRDILEDGTDFFILAILILIVIITCGFIIYYIQNPILRAVFVFLIGGTAYISSQS